MAGEEPPGLTERLIGLRDVLRDEISASTALAAARMDGMDAARQQYLASLLAANATLQAQVDQRAMALQLQIDQRLETIREGAGLLQAELDRRLETVRREAAALQLQMDQRFAGEAEARKTALVTATEAIKAALTAAETAVNKAEDATEKRFEGVNEFRKTLADQTGTFPSRTEVASQVAVVQALGSRNADALKDIELRFQSRLDTSAGQESGAAGYRTERRLDMGQVVAVVATIIAVLTFVLYVLKR